jgi:hypothetical protein
MLGGGGGGGGDVAEIILIIYKLLKVLDLITDNTLF